MSTRVGLVEWISLHGGAAHVSTLRAEGFTTSDIRNATATGAVRRVRRFWLITDRCDESLRRAAEVGGRLTCVSGAERLQLWTPAHGDLHVAVPATASRLPSSGLRLHWSTGPEVVASAALEDSIIGILFHVARCLPRRDALAVWESALNRRFVSAEVLARVQWRSEAPRALSRVASALSDSGLETRFVDLMRPLGVMVRQQVWIDGHRVDGLIGEHLIVQLDGFEHHRAGERRRDLRADARLVLRGYTILRFDYEQVFFEPEYVVAIVTAALAQGRHL